MSKKKSKTRFYTITSNPLRLRAVWLATAVLITASCMQLWKSFVPLFLLLLISYLCYRYDRYFFESLEIELKLARWLHVGKHQDKETSYSVKLQYALTAEKIIIRGYLDGYSEREHKDMTDQTNRTLFQSVVKRQLESFEVNRDYSYTTFEFFREKDQALKVSKMLENNPTNQIQLTERRKWDIDNSPHALISGGTGSGKSYLLMYLLLQFKLMEAETVVIDPKLSDLMDLNPYFTNGIQGQNKEDVLEALQKVHEELKKRQERRVASNPIEVPFVLLFDEYPAFLASLDKKDKNEVEFIINQIMLLGRSLRVFVILAMQRADTKILPGDLRDQFGLRIALSRTSKDGLTMIFADDAKELIEMYATRQGYLKSHEMTIPVKFETPEFDIVPAQAFEAVYNTLKRL